MKKTLLAAAMLAAAAAHANIIFSDSFSYPDGALVGAAGSPWQVHSGTVGPVDIASGKVNLTQAESEDVNAPLSGGPYSSGTLFASFVVNFSGLPSGTGGYFLHFKDATASGFRCKVFATTNAAAAGSYRVGVANVANAPTTFVARDLSLNTDYILVIRYDAGTAMSTLWINPASEATTDDRVDATDTAGVLPIASFALRQSLASGNGMGTNTLDNLKVGTAFNDVAGANTPPSISSIPSQSIPANTASAPIPFTINDAETLADNLTVTVTSSNQVLVVDANIVTNGSGTDRTLTITPNPNEQGTTLITIFVTDTDNNTSSNSFLLTVGAPSISNIPDQQTPTNTVTSAISFTVGDAETAFDGLSLTAISSNTGLVPNENIVFGGSGADRTVTITPSPDQAGITTITITVNDGLLSASDTFVLTVYPLLGLVRMDDFNRPDGPVVDGSGAWISHSGTFGQMQIAGEQLQINQNQLEDVSTDLAYAPFTLISGTILYAGFKVNFSELPSQSGGYFAHFKDDGLSNFRCRLFASTSNAAPDSFRLGIANAGTSPNVQIATDLTTNTSYFVVVRYNVGTGISTLWLDPASESDSGATATDASSLLNIYTFAFRESTGIGVMAVDDLKIGTSFADVVGGASGAPTISTLTNQTTRVNVATDEQPFTIGDAETPPGSLILSATSSNPGLIPDMNIVFGGGDADWTVTVVPAADQTGDATITVKVTDLDGQFASSSFIVTVLPANTPPTITAIPHTYTLVNGSTSGIPFTIFDLETAPDSLIVTAVSGNPALLPDANINLLGSDSNRTVTMTPAPDQAGVAIVTITVSDGTFSADAVFTLMVIPAPEVIFFEPFEYADGAIIDNSGGLWNMHSGAAGEMQIGSGQLHVSSLQSEDVSARLIGAPYTAGGGATLYARFTLNLAALPTTLEGNYFAHLKDNSVQNFRARIFAGTTNADPGYFRLGIANSTTNFTQLPMDLSPGTEYTVVTRYDVGTGASTLWVNPNIESDPGATAADAANPTTVTSFAFRQSAGFGTVSVDDLVIGTSFAAVMGGAVPPARFQIALGANAIDISWPVAVTGFVLETTETLNPPNWQPVVNPPITMVGDMNVLSITNAGGTAFFRLRK